MTREIEIIELQKKRNLYTLLLGATYIGAGKTSCCFLLKNGSVLKIYKNSSKKRELFQNRSMLEHIVLLSELKNESYITPKVVFTYLNEVIAYKTEYRPAKTLAKVNLLTKIQDFLLCLDKLIEDTYLIGEKNFRLKDLHDKNILFNGHYYIIDLDFGKKEEGAKENINRYNIQDIIKLLFYFLFDVKAYEILKFDDPLLLTLYHDTLYKNYTYIYSFFEALQEEMKINELQVRDLRRTHLIEKEYNSYYKLF